MSFLEKIFGKKENKTACEYALAGEYLCAKGQSNKAIKEFDKAIALEPDNDMFYASRSKAYKNIEKYQEALKDIEIALKMQPEVALYRKIKRQIMVFID
ncbi:tetratricopeptide repeat protein [bacterium]|nr:tetratricopeptide repeat protein [bacterium]